jgi:hypothetical protein
MEPLFILHTTWLLNAICLHHAETPTPMPQAGFEPTAGRRHDRSNDLGRLAVGPRSCRPDDSRQFILSVCAVELRSCSFTSQ